MVVKDGSSRSPSVYGRQQDLSLPVPGLRFLMGRRGGPAKPWERTGEIDVQQLAEWAVVDQRAGEAPAAGLNALERSAAGYEARGFSGDGIAQIEHMGLVGCKIDTSPGALNHSVHEVAEAVMAAIEGIENGGMIIHYAARLGPPTDWRPPQRWFEPAQWIDGCEEELAQWVIDDGRKKHGAYCPVIQVWGPEREARGKARYAAWLTALDDLKWRLASRNLGFLVTGPAASEAPWDQYSLLTFDGKFDNRRSITNCETSKPAQEAPARGLSRG